MKKQAQAGKQDNPVPISTAAAIHVEQTNEGDYGFNSVYIGLPADRENRPVYELRLRKKSLGELHPSDLMARRAMHRTFDPDFYWPRKGTDQRLLSTLKQCESVLLIGSPLTGKSRSLLEAFQTLASSTGKQVNQATEIVFINCGKLTQCDLTEIARERPLVVSEQQLNLDTIEASLAESEKQRFYFISDVAKLLPIRGLEDLLLQILDNGHTIVAECRSGDDRDSVRDKLPSLFSVDGWRELTLDRLAEEEVEPFQQALLKRPDKAPVDFSAVDRSIGSYFLSLAEMYGYFKAFKNDDWEKHILWALRGQKLIHGKSQGEVNRLAEYAGLRRGISVENIEDLIRSDEWTSALNRLVDLGFIYKELDAERTTEVYRAEDIYLERIVVSSIYHKQLLSDSKANDLAFEYEKETKNDVLKAYSRLENEKGPFSGLDFQQINNRIVTRVTNMSLKKCLFEELVEGELSPERYTINSMLFHSKKLGLDRAYLLGLLDELEGEDQGPNEATLSFYVGSFENFNEAREACRQLSEAYNITADEYVLRSFLRMAKNFDQAWRIFGEISEKLPEPITNPFIYYKLVKLAKRFSEAYLVFQAYQANGVDREVKHRRAEASEDEESGKKGDNIAFYESVIRKMGGQAEEVRLVMEQLKSIAEPGMIHPYTFASLIEKVGSEDFEASKALLGEAKEWLGERLNAPVYTRLIKHGQSFDIAFYYLEDLLKSPGTVTQPNVFNSVLANAKTSAEAERIFPLFAEYGIQEDIMTMAFRIKFAANDKLAFEVLQEVYVNRNDEFSLLLANQYLSRLSGGKNFKYRAEQAEEIFAIIQELDLYLGVSVKKIQRSYALLIRNFRNTTRRLDIMRYLNKYGVEIDEQNYWYCIIWSKKWEEIIQTFRMMKENAITPSVEAVRDATRKLVKDRAYDFKKFLQFVSSLQGDFPETDPKAYMNLFDVFVSLKEREKEGKGQLRNLYEQIISGGHDISALGYETLMWIELDEQRTKDVVKIQENYKRRYNKPIEVPSSYFENFFRRCSSFEQLMAFYDQMDKLEVERRVYTYVIMFDVMFRSAKRYRTADKELVKQLASIIQRANAYNRKYPSELFDNLLKSRLSNRGRIALYDQLRKKKIKLSNQARQEVFWLKTPQAQIQETVVEKATRRELLLNAVESREVLLDYIENCLVFSDAIILLEQAAIKKRKAPPISTYEAVLWLATSYDEVNQVIDLLRHREKENYRLPVTFLCRMIRYARFFEEAEDIYFNYIEERPELNMVMAYNLMRRPDASFEERARVFRRAHEENAKPNPTLVAQLSRNPITAQDALQFIALVRNYDFNLHPDAAFKLLRALPAADAWRFFGTQTLEEAVKKARQNKKHQLGSLYENLKKLRMGTLKLNELIGQKKMAWTNRLYYFLMAVDAGVAWNEKSLVHLTERITGGEQAGKMILAVSEVLSSEQLRCPYPPQENETDELAGQSSQQERAVVTATPVPVAATDHTTDHANPKKRLHLLLNEYCKNITQVNRIKRYFDHKGIAYTFTLYEKLILFNIEPNTCFNWLDEMLSKLGKNPQLIFDKMLKNGRHDLQTIQLLVELTLDSGIKLQPSLLKKIDYSASTSTTTGPTTDETTEAATNKTPKNIGSYIKRIQRARSFAEATEIYQEVDERFKRPNEDILKHYCNRVQTFHDYTVYRDYFNRIYTTLPKDVFILFEERLPRLSFVDSYAFFFELNELNGLDYIEHSHLNKILQKRGGTYTQRSQLFKHLLKLMYGRNLKFSLHAINETFAIIDDVSNAIDFYKKLIRYRKPQDQTLSFTLPNLPDVQSVIRFLKWVIKHIDETMQPADRESYYPRHHCLTGLIDRLDNQASQADCEAIWEFRNQHMADLQLNRQQYHRILDCTQDSSLALNIQSDMIENGVKPNQSTNKLVEEILLGKSTR